MQISVRSLHVYSVDQLLLGCLSADRSIGSDSANIDGGVVQVLHMQGASSSDGRGGVSLGAVYRGAALHLDMMRLGVTGVQGAPLRSPHIHMSSLPGLLCAMSPRKSLRVTLSDSDGSQLPAAAHFHRHTMHLYGLLTPCLHKESLLSSSHHRSSLLGNLVR